MSGATDSGATGRLADRCVAITGAGRGIGRAYALAMAGEGAAVVVNDLGSDVTGQGAGPETADAVVEEIRATGGRGIANHADVSKAAQARTIVDDALSEFGRLDGLVNNAAIEFRGSIEEHSAETFERVLSVNVTGSLNCTRAAIPVMRERGGGTILNTTSGGFWDGTADCSAYSASKAAVFSLTLSQHTELARFGIRSNCIAPNATRTRMVDTWIAQLSKESEKAEEEIMMQWGIQKAENLAPLAVFLCSDAAREISGYVLEVWQDRISVIERPQRGSSIARADDEWTFDELATGLTELFAS